MIPLACKPYALTVADWGGARPKGRLFQRYPSPCATVCPLPSVQDEKDRVAADVREWVMKQGGSPTKDACYAAFIGRVRDNLHIVLTMSPVGEAFRAR